MTKMNFPKAKIIDVTEGGKYDQFLHRCLVGPPTKRYRKRIEYLKKAIPKGFRKKLLVSNRDVVGQIEYAPAEASYYPIKGDDITVMNCIWVPRRAKGHDFGKLLLEDMIDSEKDAAGFVTIALENHWSPWFRKRQMEKLGFKPIDSIKVAHKTKYKGHAFSIHLMWMPTTENANSPTWDEQKLLEGITACIAQPLFHPQTYEPRQILAHV
ncbi:MAG: hypothetical protein OEX09_04975 [Candidatus Bathyarchaeota archaeon]|nr:hypothetical protein [Candidatus Bathyarchaeota archaeon]